jgi:hypothetical protein
MRPLNMTGEDRYFGRIDVPAFRSPKRDRVGEASGSRDPRAPSMESACRRR